MWRPNSRKNKVLTAHVKAAVNLDNVESVCCYFHPVVRIDKQVSRGLGLGGLGGLRIGGLGIGGIGGLGGLWLGGLGIRGLGWLGRLKIGGLGLGLRGLGIGRLGGLWLGGLGIGGLRGLGGRGLGGLGLGLLDPNSSSCRLSEN